MVGRWRGLSLLELLVALGLLAVLFVTLSTLLLTLLQASSKNVNGSAGLAVAEKTLDECIRLGTYWPVPNEQALGIYTLDNKSQTKFWSRISTVPVIANSGLQMSGGYYVEVEVWWWAEQGAASGTRRDGQGATHCKLGRFHYPGAGVTVP